MRQPQVIEYAIDVLTARAVDHAREGATIVAVHVNPAAHNWLIFTQDGRRWEADAVRAWEAPRIGAIWAPALEPANA